MNDPSTNPYGLPPAAVVDDEAVPPDIHPLIPLWGWLAIAVATSFFGTPADPVSMLIALAYGLISFCVGAALASSLHIVVRVLPLIVCATTFCLAIATDGPYRGVVAACYAAVSIGMGFWAYRGINNGRKRILSCFGAGYVVGSLLGPFGTIAGAVLGTLLAKGSLRRKNMFHGE
jgi:MFS family permease